MIKATNLAYSYTDIPLYSNGSFSVGKGMKVGLVGPNGAGKSTLFKLITKQDIPDEGSLEIDGTIGYVPQEVKHDIEMEAASSIRSYIDPNTQHEEYMLRTMLDGLELQDLELDSKPQRLSGGQKTRLALARALLREPEVLLLDEPTNFLDIEGKKWVMQFLSKYPHSVLVVSHDLKLMNNAIDKVVAINPTTRTIEEYKGNYTDFLRLKKERDEMLRRQITNEAKHIATMKKSLRKMDRFTSEKGVRVRTQLKKNVFNGLKRNCLHFLRKYAVSLLNLPNQLG